MSKRIRSFYPPVTYPSCVGLCGVKVGWRWKNYEIWNDMTHRIVPMWARYLPIKWLTFSEKGVKLNMSVR